MHAFLGVLLTYPLLRRLSPALSCSPLRSHLRLMRPSSPHARDGLVYCPSNSGLTVALSVAKYWLFAIASSLESPEPSECSHEGDVGTLGKAAVFQSHRYRPADSLGSRPPKCDGTGPISLVTWAELQPGWTKFTAMCSSRQQAHRDQRGHSEVATSDRYRSAWTQRSIRVQLDVGQG